MKASLMILALLGCWLSMTDRAEACSCLPPDPARSYEQADHVLHLRIQQPLYRTATTRYYLARLVEDDYKGCLRAGSSVIVETAASSAACGMALSRGQYLLHGARAGALFGVPRLRVGSCDANVRWGELSEAQRTFLDTRYVCCGGECACADGSEPVKCLVDPCEVAECELPGAECRANSCGGCRAEWYDESGASVCEGDDGCQPESPSRRYVSRDPEECATIRFLCAPEFAPFSDACGCGCAQPEEGAASDCKRAGCSGQRCIEASAPGLVTTCEWRDEYACYQRAECERQADGRCGFSESEALRACLAGTR